MKFCQTNTCQSNKNFSFRVCPVAAVNCTICFSFDAVACTPAPVSLSAPYPPPPLPPSKGPNGTENPATFSLLFWLSCFTFWFALPCHNGPNNRTLPLSSNSDCIIWLNHPEIWQEWKSIKFVRWRFLKRCIDITLRRTNHISQTEPTHY